MMYKQTNHLILMIFGCGAYYHVHNARLKPLSKKQVFVGEGFHSLNVFNKIILILLINIGINMVYL